MDNVINGAKHSAKVHDEGVTPIIEAALRAVSGYYPDEMDEAQRG